MRDEKIAAAVRLANDFIEKAETYQGAIKNPYQGPDDPRNEQQFVYPTAPKESGALRRASMELTRALAEMRKP